MSWADQGSTAGADGSDGREVLAAATGNSQALAIGNNGQTPFAIAANESTATVTNGFGIAVNDICVKVPESGAPNCATSPGGFAIGIGQEGAIIRAQGTCTRYIAAPHSSK